MELHCGPSRVGQSSLFGAGGGGLFVNGVGGCFRVFFLIFFSYGFWDYLGIGL